MKKITLLNQSFQALEAKADATPEEWEALAMEYYEAGYKLNAATCFMRADAIRDRPRKVGRPRKKATVEMALSAEVV